MRTFADLSGKNGLTIRGQDAPSENEWTATAKMVGSDLIVDLSAKGGPADVRAKRVADGIAFPDGNVWKREYRGPFIQRLYEVSAS